MKNWTAQLEGLIVGISKNPSQEMVVTRTTLRNKGQVTLPAEVREALHIDEGDELEFEVVEPGVVMVRGLKMIPAAQAWFWTKSWQSGERQAAEEIASGQLSGVYENIDEMFNDLADGA